MCHVHHTINTWHWFFFSLFILHWLHRYFIIFFLWVTDTQGCIIPSILPSGMGAQSKFEARGEHGDVVLFSNLGAL